MKRASFLVATFGAVALSLSPFSLAWNAFGHMSIAAAAYESLQPTIRKRVAQLLALNPQYPQWIAGVPKFQRDRVAFVRASVWADEIKGLREYENDGEQPVGPEASRNIGYRDKLQHRYWHYTDEPFSPDGTPLEATQTPNIQTQIAAFRAALTAPNVPDGVKSYDLVWLLHLVGDIHQPLHATSRFSAQQPHGDAGGNFVALCTAPCTFNLHQFWDNAFGDSRDPEAAIAAAAILPKADATLAAVVDESRWVRESFELARTRVYAQPIGIGKGPFTPDEAYRTAAQKLAADQIALAGARLATLLNQSLR